MPLTWIFNDTGCVVRQDDNGLELWRTKLAPVVGLSPEMPSTPIAQVGEALPKAPFVAGSATSFSAAKRAEKKLNADCKRVLDFIKSKGGHGATGDEIEVALGMLHQTQGARKRDLEKAGLIVTTERTRPTRTGAAAKVIVALMADGQGLLI